MERKRIDLDEGETIFLDIAGNIVQVSCVNRQGNPGATIAFYVDEKPWNANPMLLHKGKASE